MRLTDCWCWCPAARAVRAPSVARVPVVAITAVPPPVAAPEQQAHQSPPARRDDSAANILRLGEVVLTQD